MLITTIKQQLKNIRWPGGDELEGVTKLVNQVAKLTAKLQEIGAEGTLKDDGEFLLSIYRALPARHQSQWLQKHDQKNPAQHIWTYFQEFLETVRSQATNARVTHAQAQSEEPEGSSCTIFIFIYKLIKLSNTF